MRSLVNELHCAFGDVGNALGEFAGGAVPAIVVGLAPLEEEAENVDELLRVFNGVVEGDAAVLKEEGVGGALEEDIGAGIAGVKFLVHFDFERVFFVLGFPVAAREIEGVEQGAVDADGVSAFAGKGVLGNERPVVLAGAIFEKVLECSADVALLVEVAAGEALEGGVVFLDRRVGRFQV